jgi:Uma2 family endonuclease
MMMATAPPTGLLTADDLMDLPDDGNQYELVRGRLVRMPPSALASSIVAMTLGAVVTAFVRLHKLGRCSGEGGGTRLASDPDTVRAPDFMFYSNARLPARGVPRRGYLSAPDFAVEVLSPSDSFAKITAKAIEYLAAGTRLVWVVDPDARAVVIFRPGREPETLGGDAVLDGEDVLPGLSLSLAELWEGLEEVEQG